MSGVLQIAEHFHQLFGVADVQPPGGVGQCGGADFDYDAHRSTLSHLFCLVVGGDDGVHHRAPQAFFFQHAHALNGAAAGAAHSVLQRTGVFAAFQHQLCAAQHHLGGIFLGFVAIGQSFVVLWGGGEQFRIDYWTALLLFFACLWTNIQTVGIEIQRAKNMHKYRSLVYLGVLVGNIVISIPLCMKWQGLGAAIGTAVATLVGNVFLMNRYYYKHIGLNIPGFWRHISHLLPAMVLPTTVAVLLAVFVHPATYWQLIPPGLLFVAVYAASMWLFGMNRYERGLVTGPLRRILHRQ